MAPAHRLRHEVDRHLGGVAVDVEANDADRLRRPVRRPAGIDAARSAPGRTSARRAARSISPVLRETPRTRGSLRQACSASQSVATARRVTMPPRVHRGRHAARAVAVDALVSIARQPAAQGGVADERAQMHRKRGRIALVGAVGHVDDAGAAAGVQQVALVVRDAQRERRHAKRAAFPSGRPPAPTARSACAIRSTMRVVCTWQRAFGNLQASAWRRSSAGCPRRRRCRRRCPAAGRRGRPATRAR